MYDQLMEHIIKKIDPYYKVQTFNRISMSWVDIQKRYSTKEEAHKAAPVAKYRLIEVVGKQRNIIVASA